MPAGPRDIDLTRNAVRDFRHIAAHIDSFPKIREAAEQTGQQPGLARLAELIAEKLELSTSDVRDLIRGLLGLRWTIQGFKTTAKSFIDVISAQLERSATTEIEREGLETWNQKKDKILSAIESFSTDDVFVLSEKAGRLAFTHSTLVKDTQIITDIRPVFNEEGTGIVQTIITHVLVIEYQEGPAPRRIEFTLDATDLSSLKRQCVRVDQKAITAKNAMTQMPWKTSIYNEWRDDTPESETNT